jgi:hypothetical protein
MRQAGHDAQERAVERHVHHGAPFRERHLIDRLLAAQRRVVDEEVDAAEALDRGRDHAVDRGSIGDVGDGGERLAALGDDLGDDGIGLGLIGAGVDDDRGAILRQLQRDGTADVTAGAGDEGDAAGEGFGGHGVSILAASSPAKAGDPVITECTVGTGCPACAWHDAECVATPAIHATAQDRCDRCKARAQA